jgi:hypothetical protein
MRRVLFYRLYDIEPTSLGALEQEALNFQRSRAWRGDPFWLATERSTDLFSMEYFRHSLNEEGPSLAGAGFIKLLGDETDALATLFFMNDASDRFQARAQIKDEENPIAKLRYIEIRRGKLPSGMPIEEVLAARPVIKKMEGEAITFYPPTYRPNSYFRRDKPGMWGFSLRGGIRDYAPSFLEAEAEAMRIYRGFRQLPGA